MKSSPTIGTLAGALAAAQGAFKPATFNKKNPHFGSKYADLSALFDATREALAKNKLAVVQLVEPSDDGITVESVLIHESGEWISSTVNMPADKATPQAWGASITYAKRYGYSALLCIAGEDDDDGNAAQAAVVQRAVPKFVTGTQKVSPQEGTAPRSAPPSPPRSDPSAGNSSKEDSFEAIKSDLGKTLPGPEGRLARLEVSKRVHLAQKASVITTEQVAQLRMQYEQLEKGNAQAESS